MTELTATPTRHRLRLAAGLLAAAAVFAACGGGGDATTGAATETTSAPTPSTTAPPARPTGDVDRIVQTDRGGMHLRCGGQGDATVVLINGWGDAGERWAPLADRLRAETRVCSYSQLGTGRSDPALAPHTFGAEAADLDELLDTAGEPGPYVLVGHSFGGARAVTYAARHHDEVAGVLLLDATPTTWPEALCAVPDDGSATATQLARLCAAMRDPEVDPETNPERLIVDGAFAEVAEIGSLGDVPLAVVSAAERRYDGLAADEAERLSAEVDAGIRRWAALSSSSTVTLVPDTGHYIQLDQPAAVVEQIEALLP